MNVLGVYRGEPFVTGSYNPENKKTEIFDNDSKKWNVAADYPFNSGKQISMYATTSTEESVFIIGGFTNVSSDGLRTSIIAEYRADEWNNAGNLKQPRQAHGAIKSGSLTMIIGGESIDGTPLV